MACVAPGFGRGKGSAGGATDGAADALEVDVAPAGEHGVRWHGGDDTPLVSTGQDGVHTLDFPDSRAAAPGTIQGNTG